MMASGYPDIIVPILLMVLTITSCFCDDDIVIIPTTISSTVIQNKSNKNDSVSQKTSQQQQHEPYIFINGRSVAKPSNFTTNVINNSNNSISKINDCIDGETYWDSKTERCQRCTSHCPIGSIQSRPCNRSHNLECICSKGWYMSMIDGQCKQCSECPPGYGMWRTCRWSRNTVCRQCQPGTYSGVTFGTLGCIPCTKCGPNQEMIAGCDGNRDTVCIDRSSLIGLDSNSIGSGLDDIRGHQLSGGDEEDDDTDDLDDGDYPKPSRIHSFDQNHRPSSSNHLHPSGQGLPFYIALLVAVVFTFCLYALIQLRCNNLMVSTRRQQHPAGRHPNHFHHNGNQNSHRLFGNGGGNPHHHHHNHHLHQHSNQNSANFVNSSHLLPPMYQAPDNGSGHLYRSPVFPPLAPGNDLFGQQQHPYHQHHDSVMSLFTSKAIGGGKKLYYC